MAPTNPVLPDTRATNDLHAVPIPEIYKKLGTRPEGLTEAEIKNRQNRFGRNRILRVKGKPLVLKLLANFTHLYGALALGRGCGRVYRQNASTGIGDMDG